MTQWQIFAALVVGVPLVLFAVAALLPCEGCRLRRERIARTIAMWRERENQPD
ncbi:MAG: hypothetical protein GKS03_03435 [Alphaproteobacteria bacterium]|nr:hypothetical protein [Alphaproteobacteria bacterium]